MDNTDCATPMFDSRQNRIPIAFVTTTKWAWFPSQTCKMNGDSDIHSILTLASKLTLCNVVYVVVHSLHPQRAGSIGPDSKLTTPAGKSVLSDILGASPALPYLPASTFGLAAIRVRSAGVQSQQ